MSNIIQLDDYRPYLGPEAELKISGRVYVPKRRAFRKVVKKFRMDLDTYLFCDTIPHLMYDDFKLVMRGSLLCCRQLLSELDRLGISPT